MNLTYLAYKEDQIYLKVKDLYYQPPTALAKEKLHTIYAEYREVHLQYADLACGDIEALKRGLFIQWFSLTEPCYLSGIAELNEEAEKKIIQILNVKIEHNDLDDELDWMLNYYLGWDWVFDRFKEFTVLEKLKKVRSNNPPDIPDKDSMKHRGIMGQYWSLWGQV